VSWQTVLVLVVAGLLIVAVIWGAAAYHRQKQRAQAAEARVRELEGDLAASVDTVRRLLEVVDAAKLTDTDLAQDVARLLSLWSPVDPVPGG
jgi:hypothetical protein